MSNEPRHEATPHYAFGQLTRAMRTAQQHADAATRQRAQNKVAQWSAILDGMADGTLRVGSRTPVAKTPAWVTLEVAHGGFATGRYLAEGALREHELEVLATLPDQVRGDTERERLNLYFSSDAGIERLLAALREGRYEVDVPEEAALMVGAWLLQEGHGTAALELLSQLRPLMHRLRFYPRLTNQARSSGAGVHVSTAGAVVDQLRAIEGSRQVKAMNATLAVWNPLYDALVSLWLQTVEGEVPRLETANGTLVRDARGQPVAEGGWPCRVWPGDWTGARELWFARYRFALNEHRATGRHHSTKSNFQILRRFLEKCPSDASPLNEAGVTALRHALACAVHRHGIPGDPEFVSRREEDARIAGLPLHRDIAEAVATRLAELPPDEGIPSLESATHDVVVDEHPRVAAGTAIPARFVAKVERALLAPINELVERGVIGSAEVLAIVLPQLTSQVAAAGIDDPTCRDLFARTYSAFRRRRSLLLLNLEHQVTIDELPWVAALQTFRHGDPGTAQLALQTLREVTLLAFEQFPHTIIPNPLLREMVTLSKRAELDLPLVEEIAADIFMGTFTKKFTDAALLTSEVLKDTLYARYYSLPVADQLRATEKQRGLFSRWGKKDNPAFDELCATRAAEAGHDGGVIAKNGAILEQMQILTSYNLATLVHGLDLHRELTRRGADMANKAFRWALNRQSQLPTDHLPRLRATKNAAYAWRQGIFFLSFAEASDRAQVLDGLTDAVAATSANTRSRFSPVVAGLRFVGEGGTFDERGLGSSGQRRFLGWSCGTHWLLSGVSND